MASRRDVVTFLTAPARSGKSFNEVRRICDEIIPHEKGAIYTNLPLFPEKIAEYCFAKYKVDPSETFRRIELIPREIELEWKQAGQPLFDVDTGKAIGKNPATGPWDYFADKNLSGATIIIDEIHNFCGSIGTPKAISNQWQAWLGELGHNQAVFRCLSQAPEKVHTCIKQEAQAQYTIRNTGLDRDPYFKIEIYDWLELFCGLFKIEHKVFVFEQETKKVEGRKVRGKRKLHRMGPPYFDFYDSFNAPIAHAQANDVKAFEHEFEKQLQKGAIRGRLGISWWFFKRYFYELTSRSIIAVLLLVMLIGLMSGALPKYLSAAVIGLTSSAVGATTPNTAAGQMPTKRPPNGSGSVPSAIKKNPVNERLIQEREALRKQLSDEKQKNERLQKELQDASAIILISTKSITLRGGYTYEIGEIIDTGPYKGKTFVEINWKRRSAILDDGTILKLGS